MLVSASLFPSQVWNIEALIRQHDYWTVEPQAAHNKKATKMCNFITQHSHRCCKGLWEGQIVMLTAGMSTGTVRQNVHFAIISCLRRPFKEFDITSSRPHRPRLTTPGRDLRMQHLHLRDHHHRPPGRLLQQMVCRTKEFLHKRPEDTSGKPVCSSV